MKKTTFATSILALALSGPAAAALVVDGNLNDWQINKDTLVSSLAGAHYTVEDSTGGANAYLGPGYGGQAYDAEAMYAVFQGGKLFIALMTGHDPLTVNNPAQNKYGAGDFAIDFGKNGIYELGINVIVNGFGVAGGVYANPAWAYGLWDVNGNYNPGHPDTTHPTSLVGGNLIGMASYAYTTNGVGGYGAWKSDKHFFYELSIDLGLLYAAGWDGGAFNIQWTENCANDSIVVDPGRSVPEPGSLALAGLGMIGVIRGGLRRRKVNAETSPAAG